MYIGEIVHFFNGKLMPGMQPQAAIVVSVVDEKNVNLKVFLNGDFPDWFVMDVHILQPGEGIPNGYWCKKIYV